MSAWEWDLIKMNNTNEKLFSNNLLALQMQIQTIMEESGGRNAITLLDAISQLGEEEQNIVLNYFTNVTKRLCNGDIRIKTQNDIDKSQFEDKLFSDLMQAFNQQNASQHRLELLQGGKSVNKGNSKIVEFKKFSHNKVLQ